MSSARKKWDEAAQDLASGHIGYEQWLERTHHTRRTFGDARMGAADAEDVAQEAALAAWLALGRHDPAQGPVGQHLYLASHYAVLASRRKMRRAAQVVSVETVDVAPTELTTSEEDSVVCRIDMRREVSRSSRVGEFAVWLASGRGKSATRYAEEHAAEAGLSPTTLRVLVCEAVAEARARFTKGETMTAAAETATEGLKYDAMSLDRVRAHYKEVFKKEATKKDSVKKLVDRLETEYRRKHVEERMALALCADCGARSDHELNDCPMCGSVNGQHLPAIAGDVVETNADAPAPKSGKAAKPAPTLVRTEQDDEPPVAPAEPAAGLTEADLDAALTNFKQLQETAAGSYFALGEALGKIQESSIWRLRKDENGKPAYVSFEQFLRAETGWTKKYAYRAMKVARVFTREQVQAFGHSKLGVLLELPEEQRAQLLETGEGLSKRELEKEANAAKGTDDEAAEPAPRVKTVSLVIPDERHAIPLYASKANAETGEYERAADLDCKPQGTLETDNGVTITFRLSRQGGKLSIILETARED